MVLEIVKGEVNEQEVEWEKVDRRVVDEQLEKKRLHS